MLIRRARELLRNLLRGRSQRPEITIVFDLGSPVEGIGPEDVSARERRRIHRAAAFIAIPTLGMKARVLRIEYKPGSLSISVVIVAALTILLHYKTFKESVKELWADTKSVWGFIKGFVPVVGDWLSTRVARMRARVFIFFVRFIILHFVKGIRQRLVHLSIRVRDSETRVIMSYPSTTYEPRSLWLVAFLVVGNFVAIALLLGCLYLLGIAVVQYFSSLPDLQG